MSITVPEGLRHSVSGDETGPGWLASLADLVARAVDRWGLVVGEPFGSGMAAWTAPATTRDGTEVVLKLSFPHIEARDEAAALAVWGGTGAVELLGSDADDWALLLPRLRPGGRLTEAALPVDRHLAIGAEILRRLASAEVPPGRPFADLVDVATDLAAVTEGRIADTLPQAPYPVDVGLCRHAVVLLRSMPESAEHRGLAHGDLNPGNILSRSSGSATGGQDDGWMAIDPKPVHGDLAWDPWPLLTQVGDWTETTPGAAELADRTRLVADATGLDAFRIASWCAARSVASGLWAADRGWWTGFRGADGDLSRAGAWAQAAARLGG